MTGTQYSRLGPQFPTKIGWQSVGPLRDSGTFKNRGLLGESEVTEGCVLEGDLGTPACLCPFISWPLGVGRLCVTSHPCLEMWPKVTGARDHGLKLSGRK